MHAPSIRLRAALLLAAVLVLPAPAAAQRDSPFMQEFRKLMALQAMDEMVTLVKQHENEALVAVREIVVLMRDESNETLEVEIDALGKVWKKAYDSDFVTLQYGYFALRLTGPYKRLHREASTRFEKKLQEFDEAVAAKATAKYPGLALDYEALGDQLSELGDHYLAAQSYWNAAVLMDDVLNGKQGANYRRACELWGLALQARDEAHLCDKSYAGAKARFDYLMTAGFGVPEEAAPVPAEPAAGAGEAAPKAVPLAATFQLVPDIEAIQRPLYTADSNFQIWSTVPLKAIDSSAKFVGLDPSPAIVRTGANKAAVDLDGDGKGDVDIPLTGKIAPVQVTLGEGAAQRGWAFLAVIGQQRDTFQGFTYNLGPDQATMNLYVAPAGSLVGALDGVRVQVIDDNFDGLYGSAPKDWAYDGLLEGVYQRDVDSVVVGEANFARPWSRLQKIGAAWYELQPNEAGTDISAARVEVASGTLQLDMKGPPVPWLVVRGAGEKNDLFYDVAAGGTNKVEVPAGTYELFSGQVASGKKAQMLKALVLPGANARSWKVGAGETVKLELGAPFVFDFKYAQNEESVTVEGPTIVVTGRGGETYQRLWNCVLAPEVHLRKVGSSRGKKEEELVPAGSIEELETLEWDMRAAWFPIGKPITKPSPDPVEVMLFQKKHKLFGTVESDWKGN
ncbi:MAG: hypothetical protein HOP15_14135 [Planctomycetes bacterium]|nr:hypothetical protein [Planctomycetota bacterium]